MKLSTRRWPVVGSALWAVAAVLVVLILGVSAFELFFVVSFMGFLTTVYIVSHQISSRMLARARLLLAVGFVVFSAMAVSRLLTILPI